uniref:Pentatricopeptide repeat-containing protein At3g24000 n=1 Tax=Rhizophora mucronata TaxID=61149 RepID=A0A2P2MXA2_RHIMU
MKRTPDFMECNFIADPSPNFRFLALPSFFRPISLVKVSCKQRSSSTSPLLFSRRVKFSVHGGISAIESNPTSDLKLNSPRNSFHGLLEANGKIPGEFSFATWPDVLSKAEENVTSGRVNFGKEVLKRYSGKLRECAEKGTLNYGRAIHGKLIKIGVELDSHLWVSLINFYAKCGSQVSARKVLDGMPERDVVSWNALISGCISEGNGGDGVSLYCQMREENLRPNEFVFATALKACSMGLDTDFGKQIHAEAVKAGFLSDLFVGSALVDYYAKCGELELAGKVFFGMPEKNNLSWNALLHGYARGSNADEAFRLFSHMMECETMFSEFTLCALLKGCANSGNLRQGKSLHCLAIKSGYELDEILCCTLVDMYCKFGMASDALQVFKRIKDPDIVTWTAIITGLDHQGHSQEAAEIFNQMRRTGVRPNQFSLSSVVGAATNMCNLHFGTSIHASICKCGFEFDKSVSNALIKMYMKSGCVQDGIQVFEAMTDRDLVSWNAVLAGFYDFEACDLGPKIFYRMLVEGFKPNVYTFISILRSCSSLVDIGFGKQVHAHIIKNSIDSDDFVLKALIDMYAKGRCLEGAEVAFNRLTKRDLFTWTAIISSYAQSNQVEMAPKYLSHMQRDCIKPNEFTLASCLSACSRMATLENGQQLHSLAIKTGHFSDVFVSTALVDMYGKCGCIEDAELIFQGLVSRDTVSWNMITTGYSQHGKGEKALEAFRMMLDEGILPDEVTFKAVLSACSHMGLIEEGKRLFKLMNEAYGITPSIEHCACMVDILGRAGKFGEVASFVDEMKLTPYPLIWETVLGACKLHGNVDFGERAARKLFELKPKMGSSYVLLSNILAAEGRWDDVKNIRALMSATGVKKEPGCSWVEVDGRAHVFVSQDDSHAKIREIKAKLEDLGQKLTSMGYIPQTDNVLHNIANKEKREQLYHHSERLALAFALISASPLKTIRIFKNLRICGDCHDFMKLVSGLTNRQIVVRDIKRFHHFHGGTCSCNDYW